MSPPEVGEIYETFVEYRQAPGEGKTRPVVVLHVLDDGSIVAAAAITSKNGNNRFSNVKLPILNWRKKQTGLTSMSWVIVNDIRIFECKALKKRLGVMHPLDFHRLIASVNDL